MIARALVLIALTVATARAESRDEEPCDLACTAGKADAMRKRGDAAGARDLLSRAYQQSPHPQLLFALGQVEQELERFEIAIDY